MNLLGSTVLLTTGLFSLHWAFIQVYSYYCAPPGIQGLFKSLITSPSTLCIGLNYAQFYSVTYYYKCWIAALIVSLKAITGYMDSRTSSSQLTQSQAGTETDQTAYHIKTRSKTKSQ